MKQFFFSIFFFGVTFTMSAQKIIVATPDAPKALGPYSQAVVVGNMLFASGQIPIDPKTGNFVEGGISEQTEQVLRNLQTVIEHAGFAMTVVVSCTVYLKDMNDFTKMNEVYAKHFTSEFPSRATVQVSRLPKDALVEISCSAVRAQ